MGARDISFPNLGLYFKNVPQDVNIFGFHIMFYGIIIALGMLLAILMCSRHAKERGINPECLWDMSLYGIFVGIIGARLYFVIMSWDQYKDNLLDIFNLRLGGLAVYGGVIGGFVTVLVYSKIKKLDFFLLSDFVAEGLLVGQLMGRWGNFFNREVFGGYTNNLFAMRLPIAAVRASDITPKLAETIIEGTNYIQVAPTFLYESLWNLGLLIIILAVRKRKRFEGELLFIYLFGYGLGRFWIEAIRTDQLLIPGTQIPVSMVVATVSMLIATFGFILFYKKAPRTQYVVGDFGKENKDN